MIDAHPQPRRRLHASTYVVLLLAAAVLFLLNVPSKYAAADQVVSSTMSGAEKFRCVWDPNLWWVYLEGFHDGVYKDAEERIKSAWTGITFMSIQCFFPSNVRERAYKKGFMAGQGLMFRVGWEFDMLMIELREPGARKRTEELTNKFLEEVTERIQKNARERDSVSSRQPEVEK